MKRGEIWWANLPQPAGRRPVLLLSRDEAYPVRDFIILSPLTTHGRGLHTEVNLGPEDGLPGTSVANLDVIINTIQETPSGAYHRLEPREAPGC